jgi:hypothetical protein
LGSPRALMDLEKAENPTIYFKMGNGRVYLVITTKFSMV